MSQIMLFLPPLIEGAWWTVALSFTAAFGAVAVGLLVCVCKMAGSPLLSRPARIYIEIIRGTPLLLQLFYLYYGLPEIGIVMPALRNIFPALGNYALVLVKDSSLVAVISVLELMRAGELLASATFKALEVYTLVGAIYLLICFALSRSFLAAERRLAIPGHLPDAAKPQPAKGR
jgi:polar amino acid transport system permease protein